MNRNDDGFVCQVAKDLLTLWDIMRFRCIIYIEKKYVSMFNSCVWFQFIYYSR